MTDIGKLFKHALLEGVGRLELEEVDREIRRCHERISLEHHLLEELRTARSRLLALRFRDISDHEE